MKKITLTVAGVLTIFLVLGIIIQTKKYYDNTYVSSKAYTKAPAVVAKREITKDDAGNTIKGSYSYNYHFNFVTTNGTVKKISFELSGENIKPFKDNEFLEAEISNTRVVYGPTTINKNNVPKALLNKVIRNNP